MLRSWKMKSSQFDLIRLSIKTLYIIIENIGGENILEDDKTTGQLGLRSVILNKIWGICDIGNRADLLSEIGDSEIAELTMKKLILNAGDNSIGAELESLIKLLKKSEKAFDKVMIM